MSENGTTRRKAAETAATTFPAVSPLIVTEAATPAEAAQPTIPKRAERTRRAPRPEIQAMNRIDVILAELDKDEIQRVLMWAIATHAPEGFSASTKLAPQAMCDRPRPIPADPDFPNAGP